MKVVYLHGLESKVDPSNPKVLFLNDFFDEAYIPVIDYDNSNTFETLLANIEEMKADFLIGSSMGGYFGYLIGSKLGIKTILFNPAVVCRSIDPPVDDSGLKGSENVIITGDKDDFINPLLVRDFFEDSGVGSFRFINYDGGHRVPFDVFKVSIESLI